MEALLPWYLWLKALHIIAVISWMAALLYLPRLFVYHAEAGSASHVSPTFKVMERRLSRYIMTPAMIAAWLFGLLMFAANPELIHSGWVHAKLTLIILLTGLHHVFLRYVRLFAEDRNTKSSKFFCVINEAPTLLMIAIVLLAVLKPF